MIYILSKVVSKGESYFLKRKTEILLPEGEQRDPGQTIEDLYLESVIVKFLKEVTLNGFSVQI
jgi:hypothetical protein